eukprot:5016651-Pleurochrysis_carterae.AAC.3
MYTDNAKPPKDPSILRAKRGLRQQGARRRDRDLGADCLEQRSDNQLPDGVCHVERESQSGRAVVYQTSSGGVALAHQLSLLCGTRTSLSQFESALLACN